MAHNPGPVNGPVRRHRTGPAMPQIPDDIDGYAYGHVEVEDQDHMGTVGKRNNGGTRAIRSIDLAKPLTSNDFQRGRSIMREDISPYATDYKGVTARSHDAKQVGDKNTGRAAVVGGGRAITDSEPGTTPGGDLGPSSSLQQPGSVAPYANESRVTARTRVGEGL